MSISCKSSVINYNSSDVTAVKFRYLPKGFDSNKAIHNSLDIFGYTYLLRDTIIKDRDVIGKYVSLLNKLKLSKSTHAYDLRILSIMKLTDGSNSPYIMFGENRNILYDDSVLLDDNPELFEFLDNLLYSESE